MKGCKMQRAREAACTHAYALHMLRSRRSPPLSLRRGKVGRGKVRRGKDCKMLPPQAQHAIQPEGPHTALRHRGHSVALNDRHTAHNTHAHVSMRTLTCSHWSCGSPKTETQYRSQILPRSLLLMATLLLCPLLRQPNKKCSLKCSECPVL